jgi:hypothetical protein
MHSNLIPLLLLAATLTASGCNVREKNSNGTENVKIETPFGGVKVNTDESAIASDIGLPLYPGATRVKDKDSGAADINMNFGDFHLRVKALGYRTSDSPDKVIAFYRKGLSTFGDVIECRDNHSVGNPSKTRQGLTCDNDKENHMTVNGAPEHAEVELKAGSKTHQHIVAVEKQSDGTKFGLVALELPKEKESN